MKTVRKRSWCRATGRHVARMQHAKGTDTARPHGPAPTEATCIGSSRCVKHALPSSVLCLERGPLRSLPAHSWWLELLPGAACICWAYVSGVSCACSWPRCSWSGGLPSGACLLPVAWSALQTLCGSPALVSAAVSVGIAFPSSLVAEEACRLCLSCSSPAPLHCQTECPQVIRASTLVLRVPLLPSCEPRLLRVHVLLFFDKLCCG